MAEHAQHGHGHHAADHVPHPAPVKVYLATWGALVVLTAITVAASYVDFGAGNLIIALLIATVKATVVAALFMHLLHDHKFHALILTSGGLFLIIFVAFTMFDTEYRGRADAFEGERPADIHNPFGGGTTTLAAMRAKYDKAQGAASAEPLTPPGSAPAGAPAAATASAAPEGSASAAPEGSAAPEASAAASGSVAPEASAAPSGSVAPGASAASSAAPAASSAAPAGSAPTP